MLRAVRDKYAWAILLAAWLMAGARVVRRPVRREPSAISEALAKQVYLEITGEEAEERRSAALRFQGNGWSQQDDFHAKEKGTVRNVAREHHVSISSAISALDRGMRERWPTKPNAVVAQKVIPCRPRLAY